MYMLSRFEFEHLATQRHELSLSFYLPTHAVTADKTRQDPVRLKQLLRQAEGLLRERGQRPSAVEKFLAPLWTLQQDPIFWLHQSSGLAIFFSPELYRYYRLPLIFEEKLLVGDRFYLKPLLPLITNNGRYFVLALSKDQSRLFECTRFEAAQVPVEQMPQGLAEALRYDDPQRQVQYHTAPSGGGSGKRQAAMFHGHGVGTDDEKSNILRYFQQVETAMQELLRNHPLPVVLYGVEYLHGLYREASRYPNLVDHGLTGNPDLLKAKDLPDRVWPIVQTLFEQAQETAVNAFKTLEGTGRTSVDLLEILNGAVDGQVAVLFLLQGATQWGRFDPEARQVHLAAEGTPDGEDLLDTAAFHAFAKGGAIYVLEPASMPTRQSIAAILRW